MLKDEEYKKLFKGWFTDNYPKVCSFIYGYVNDYDLARGIAQETFLALWENREKAATYEDCLPYLFFVAKNKSLNVLRRDLSRRRYSSYMEKFSIETLNVYALSHSTSTSVYSKEIETITRNTIDKLNPKIRETFLLSKEERLKYSEIAKRQNVSVKTVEYRISFALRELRRSLKDYLPFLIGIFLPILFN